MDQKKTQFQNLKNKFKCKIQKWQTSYPDLTFVYNQQFEKIDVNSIKYILVADNPGKYEKERNRYLIGESGIAARCFFKSELDVSEFDKEVLVLNKTPMYSDKTEDLLELYDENEKVLIETQEFMCEFLYDIHEILKCKVFIIGFSGCRNKESKTWIVKDHANKRTLPYFFSKLKQLYGNENSSEFTNLYLFKHFSMMQFYRDIAQEIGYENYVNSLKEELFKLGKKYRKELIGR